MSKIIKKQVSNRDTLSVREVVNKRRVNDELVADDHRTAKQREVMLSFAHKYCLMREKTLNEQEQNDCVDSEFVQNELDFTLY
jgi:hypothetical protein